MRPATTLTLALLFVLILGAAVVAFFFQPNTPSTRCSGTQGSGVQGQTISCEAPDSAPDQT